LSRSQLNKRSTWLPEQRTRNKWRMAKAHKVAHLEKHAIKNEKNLPEIFSKKHEEVGSAHHSVGAARRKRLEVDPAVGGNLAKGPRGTGGGAR